MRNRQPRSKGLAVPRQPSQLELSFALWLRVEKMPAHETEYVFAKPRLWRFDFAWPDRMFAVEIDGGLYQGGRHQTLSGYVLDCLKFERALQLGWTVYRIPAPWVSDGKRDVWRPEVMDTMRLYLFPPADGVER